MPTVAICPNKGLVCGLPNMTAGQGLKEPPLTLCREN